jgi:hypothetical protein
VHLVGIIINKFVTMHGHMNIKKTEGELRYVTENLKGNKIYVFGNLEFKSKNHFKSLTISTQGPNIWENNFELLLILRTNFL